MELSQVKAVRVVQSPLERWIGVGRLRVEATEPALLDGVRGAPAADMDAMKMDMCGAAAVIGAMVAIAQLKPKLNVTGLVPTAENMPSGTAYRPGDILRASNGKTIEILNTDAEGRLILADALTRVLICSSCCCAC